MPETVIVFGASGFVGRNLLDALRGHTGDIIAVSRRGAAVQGATRSIAMSDLETLGPLAADTVAIHVAAYRYDATRAATLQSDILTANVAIVDRIYQFCAARGIKEVRAASSVAVYPAHLTIMDDAIAIDRNAAPNPGEAFYAWSKRWGEIIASLYHEQYGIATLSFRLSNPYGPHDSLDEQQAHVVPAFILRALQTTGDFTIRGNPDVERDFIHISDVCDIFLRSLDCHGMNIAINLCRGTTNTLRELAETIIELTGNRRKLATSETIIKGVMARRSTNRTVSKMFGKTDFVELRAGLIPTIEWYKNALRANRR